MFSSLRVRQFVSLKYEGPAFTVTFFDPELPQSHKVVGIDDNFIVVRDIAEVSEAKIPIFSIKAIVRMKTKAQ